MWVSLSSDTAADSRERQHGPSAKGWKYAVTGEKSEIMVREPWMNHGSTGKNASNVVHMDIGDTLELYDLPRRRSSDVDFDNDFPKFHRPMGFWFHGNNSPESMAFFPGRHRCQGA